VLDAVAEHLPDLLPFVSSTYASLRFSFLESLWLFLVRGFNRVIPWDPFLFCLAIAGVLWGGIKGDLVMGTLMS